MTTCKIIKYFKGGLFELKKTCHERHVPKIKEMHIGDHGRCKT